MQYKFEEDFIVARAETLQENAVLLSTQGALRLEAVKDPPHKLLDKPASRPYPKREILKEEERLERRAKMQLIRDKIDKIGPGESVFIPNELSNASNYFQSYVANLLKRQLRIRGGTHKVDGGYEISKF